MPEFYSVQSPADAARLVAGGEPWPTGLRRANLGIGLYAWDSLAAAERYRSSHVEHGVEQLTITIFTIAAEDLVKMKTLDLTRLTDEEVDAWMAKYSHYGNALPHAFDYVVRSTDKGIEHYFRASVFSRLREVK